MPPLPSASVHLDAQMRAELERLVRQHTAPQNLVLRVKIVLHAADGMGVEQTARDLAISPQTARKWRERWNRTEGRPIEERLSDIPRPGAPPKFTPEQICQIIRMACERPQDSDKPITDWTQRELAREAIRRGIVVDISQRSIGRFFK